MFIYSGSTIRINCGIILQHQSTATTWKAELNYWSIWNILQWYKPNRSYIFFLFLLFPFFSYPFFILFDIFFFIWPACSQLTLLLIFSIKIFSTLLLANMKNLIFNLIILSNLFLTSKILLNGIIYTLGF